VSVLPIAPWEEARDEQTDGVLLLEGDDECKTTAERLEHGWRITDWEVALFCDKPHWFARWWHVIPDRYLDAITKAKQP